MKPTTIIALAAACLAAGCGKSGGYEPKPTLEITPAKFTPGEERSIMPLEVGNQWVFVMQTGNQTRDITIEVVSVEVDGDGKTAVIEVNDGLGNVQPSTWHVDSTGVYQMTARDNEAYDPPQLLVPFPFETGREFTIEGTGPLPVAGVGPYKTEGKVLGPQEIDTAMGDSAVRMSAIAVQSITTWETDEGKNVSRATTWWAPGIGFVRQMQEFSTPGGKGAVLLKLKSYSFK